MFTSNHAAAKVAYAAGGVAAVAAVVGVADVAARTSGFLAGALVVTVVFAGCWIIRQGSALVRHRAPARRPARGRDPQPVTLADSQQPTQLAA